MSRNYERFISFSHLYFYPLELNTYQFDFKLHYQAYIIFMSVPLVYLFIYLFFKFSLYTYMFYFSSWAAICFNKLVFHGHPQFHDRDHIICYKRSITVLFFVRTELLTT